MRRYRISQEVDLNVPAPVEDIPELIESDHEAEVEGIVLMLNMADISSFKYTPEGISNCFFVRHRDDSVLYQSSVPYILIEGIRYIQQSLLSIFNTKRLGQVLKGVRKIWFHPLAWTFIIKNNLSLSDRYCCKKIILIILSFSFIPKYLTIQTPLLIQ